MDQIYLFDGKVKLGPFSIEEIKQMTIAPGTKFWYQGLTQWLPIEKLPVAKIGGESIQINKKPLNQKLIKRLWFFTLIVIAIILSLYGVFFDNLSETELVEISFYWFGPIVFCIVALISAYNCKEKAVLYGLIGALIGILALVLFFTGLWSSL